jgi:YD repeat-containing protein
VFTETYNAAGNRLTEATQYATTVYTYDAANRLTNLGASTYQWDANGNLLSTGAYTGTYNAANRLITATQSGMTSTFTYNGLGDRVKQTINGVVTTYTLDLNAGLTQVLADGTNAYLYGLSRIAQQNTSSTDYFLPDALGSVRQLANVSTTVTLARNYDPYGNVLSSAGYRSTSYNFTGELRDSGTGLLYTSALVTMQTA